jgi:hypothetical protein
MAVSVTSVLDAAMASLNIVTEVVTICTTRFSIKNFRSARTVCCVFSWEKYRLFSYAASIDWFYNRGWEYFLRGTE